MNIYELLGQASTSTITNAYPYVTPERDEDPMGVFLFEPYATETSKLYYELDPETCDDFDRLVHDRNTADAVLLKHCRNNFLLALTTLKRLQKNIGPTHPCQHELDSVIAKLEEIDEHI